MANHILVWKHHIDVITDGTNWDALKKMRIIVCSITEKKHKRNNLALKGLFTLHYLHWVIFKYAH